MRIWNFIALGLLFAASLFSQSGLTPDSFDKSVSPCTNFYQHACGVWLQENPLPGDQARWGRFDQLNENNQTILRGILEEAAKGGAGRTRVEQQIGDYYGACMDEKSINEKGAAPLQPELARIRELNSKESLPELIAHLHRISIDAMFRFGPMPDFKDSTVYMADLDQGGLGLPDRDYYFRDDDKSKEQRGKYVQHIQRMFELLGDSAGDASAKAASVMRIETALAEGSMELVKRRDPENVWHPMSVAELEELSPNFDWRAYFERIGSSSFDRLNVDAPGFIEALDAVVSGESLADLQTYLSWHLLTQSAPLLSEPFVNEDFGFYRQTLSGAKEQRPRWKRCVRLVDRDLGEALGQAYVAKAFPPESKARMLELVAGIEKALGKDIEALPWMTKATKAKAMEKLHAVRNKIGYPDKWRDYSGLEIQPGDALGNRMRAQDHESARQLAKIGGKVDGKEWYMTPPTVNAYYHPLENTINFPAGILQPPFFDANLDYAPNYGGIGAVIAHELTHGFDDQGRKFAANGNLEEWWTEDDAANFEAKAKCFIDQYSEYTAVEEVKLNGELTLGENVADNGGLRLAYMALMDTLDGEGRAKKIDGLTPVQRLFYGWARVWCQNSTNEMMRMQAQTDPHSLSEQRVNGVVSNMPEFREAFSCKETQPMVRERACKIW